MRTYFAGTHISLVIALVVFLLIAFRQVLTPPPAIWQIMLGGAVAMLLSGAVTPAAAVMAVDPEVMIFLFSVLLLGAALEESGWLAAFAGKLLGRAGTTGTLVTLVVVLAAVGAALLTNDTIAVIGTPLLLSYARHAGIKPHLLLTALAFGVTTGSVASPVGNPQNLLVAAHGGFSEPFVQFFIVLAPPTAIALVVVCAVLYGAARDEWGRPCGRAPVSPAGDHALVGLLRLSLLTVVLILTVRAFISHVFLGVAIPLAAVAASASIPFLLSRWRTALLHRVDWPTLVFFAAMFVVMEGVRESGALEEVFGWGDPATLGVPAIIATGMIASQIISNVPFVALALPLLEQAGAGPEHLLALAAGSTIAGNLTLLGAASNVIIVQGAERRGVILGFGAFVRLGVPLSLVQGAVYAAWLLMI
ncbi:anion transporter [Methanofollis aquaemaris]|uniref:Anion transporter n=1 Tax=Methanofollis aquaemaris TaxID=126734 RepID=A0A8A3S343_9EURY|nr:SLC13 family permease [Methanofollis aquaemaris]QSZ66578.1 anion transporter [Methanofollis aquaemaris]